MVRVIEVVLVLLTPTLAAAGCLGLIRVWRAADQFRRARRWGAAIASAPIEQVAADLQRLRRAVTTVEDAMDGAPGRRVRLDALRASYADTLLAAGLALDVPVDRSALEDLPEAETYRVESALRDRGLDVYASFAR